MKVSPDQPICIPKGLNTHPKSIRLMPFIAFNLDIPTKNHMTAKPSPEAQSLLKEQRLREIVTLLKHQGPLEAKAIAATIADVSIHATNHYLDELLIARNIRKVHSPGKPKNIKAYEYWSDYDSKTDMVSMALSNPLHQVIASIVKKRD